MSGIAEYSAVRLSPIAMTFAAGDGLTARPALNVTLATNAPNQSLGDFIPDESIDWSEAQILRERRPLQCKRRLQHSPKSPFDCLREQAVVAPLVPVMRGLVGPLDWHVEIGGLLRRER